MPALVLVMSARGLAIVAGTILIVAGPSIYESWGNLLGRDHDPTDDDAT